MQIKLLHDYSILLGNFRDVYYLCVAYNRFLNAFYVVCSVAFKDGVVLIFIDYIHSLMFIYIFDA